MKNNNTPRNRNIENSHDNKIGIFALVLALLGSTAFIGIILGFMGVRKKESRSLSVAALVISICWFIIFIWGYVTLFNWHKRSHTIERSYNVGTI